MSLIDAVLSALVEGLENDLQAVSARSDRWIAFGPPGAEAGDGIRAAVLSIDPDTILGRFEARQGDAASVPVGGAPPLTVDVLVAFVSDVRPDHYLVGIRMISEIVSSMQERPAFEAEMPSGRARETARLHAELVALDIDRRSRAAAVLGAAGRPFVVYRLRRLSFGGASFGAVASRVGGSAAGAVRQ